MDELLCTMSLSDHTWEKILVYKETPAFSGFLIIFNYTFELEISSFPVAYLPRIILEMNENIEYYKSRYL